MPHWKLCEYYERLNHLINQFADNFEKVLAEFSIYLYIISRVPHRAHIRPQPAIILLLDINSKDVILWSIILLVLIIPCFVKMSPQMIFYHIKYLHQKDNLLIFIYFQFFLHSIIFRPPVIKSPLFRLLWSTSSSWKQNCKMFNTWAKSKKYIWNRLEVLLIL